MSKTVAGAEHVTTEKLMDDLRTVVGDAEELLKATASQTGERIAAVRAKAEESLKSARAGLAEAQAAVVAKTKEAALATDEYVRANPWESVGVAAAVGLVIGMLIARR
ncbi:MAG: DUF883 family protein [Gammaproteobacteria bacterium]|nr:DUF883 family protein [Gammaproteobacteria bacterium]